MIIDFNLFRIVTASIIIITIILLLLLIKIYINSYKKIRIGFTLGLILFATFFLIKALMSLLLLLHGFTYTDKGANNMIFNDAIIELIAIAILYKITRDN